MRKLEKKFSKIFDMLGLTPSEMLHTAKLTSNLSNEELNERISSSLESKFSAVKNNTEKKYEFSVLNGLNSELQAELVKTLIWPKMNVALKETLAIANSIQNTKSDNKYMKMVINFAEENNFNPDLVIHSLKNNPELLADYPNSKKIFANQNQILENADKYSKVIENNFSYLKEIIQATESLKTIISTLGIQQEVKDNLLKLINQSIVLEKREGNISYEQITKNLVQAEQAKEKTLSSKNPM